MTSTLPGLTVREVSAVRGADDPDLRAYVDIANAAEVEDLGPDAPTLTYGQAAASWRPHDYGVEIRALAHVHGEPVGRLYQNLPRTENVDVILGTITVRPDFRRRGIGTALLGMMEETARTSGRGTIHLWAGSTLGNERVAARTGSGSVASAAPGTRFLLAAGFTLEQAERASRIDLPTARRPRRGDLGCRPAAGRRRPTSLR